MTAPPKAWEGLRENGASCGYAPSYDEALALVFGGKPAVRAQRRTPEDVVATWIAQRRPQGPARYGAVELLAELRDAGYTVTDVMW